jgi:hypothetical protein
MDVMFPSNVFLFSLPITLEGWTVFERYSIMAYLVQALNTPFFPTCNRRNSILCFTCVGLDRTITYSLSVTQPIFHCTLIPITLLGSHR